MIKMPSFLLFSFWILFLFSCGGNSDPDGKKEEIPLEEQGTFQHTIPMPDKLKMLQGSWVSLNDTPSRIMINGNNYISFLHEKEVSRETIEVYENCPPYCSDGSNVISISCFVVKGAFDATCYQLHSISQSDFTCSLLGGTGKILHFRRE